MDVGYRASIWAVATLARWVGTLCIFCRLKRPRLFRNVAKIEITKSGSQELTLVKHRPPRCLP